MAASLWIRCTARNCVFVFTSLSPKETRRLSVGQKLNNTNQEYVSESSEPLQSNKNVPRSTGETGLAGFARALEKARSQNKEATVDNEGDDIGKTEYTTFPAMLRHSKLMQLGDIAGRMVAGTIIEVVGDDLYIDIGGKFHCVCPRPKLNAERYHQGTKVKVQVNDLEMSSSFLGSKKHITLLEADGTLIGLRRQSQH